MKQVCKQIHAYVRVHSHTFENAGEIQYNDIKQELMAGQQMVINQHQAKKFLKTLKVKCEYMNLMCTMCTRNIQLRIFLVL